MLVIQVVTPAQAWEHAEIIARNIVRLGEADATDELIWQSDRGVEIENPTTGHTTRVTWDKEANNY